MIFNFTRNHQFTTRLKLNNENVEIVREFKLLGTIITDDLQWNENTQFITKKHGRECNCSTMQQNLQEKKVI
jgi:hypothetical protein